jgi:hypothetical protein
VCLFTQSGTHLVADPQGFCAAGATYTALAPQRVFDTRPASRVNYSGSKPPANSFVQFALGSAVPADATAVVLNVTGTEATAPGFVTVWPCGQPRPTASSLNLDAGATTPNLAFVKVGNGGSVCLYSQSGTHVVADLEGFER